MSALLKVTTGVVLMIAIGIFQILCTPTVAQAQYHYQDNLPGDETPTWVWVAIGVAAAATVVMAVVMISKHNQKEKLKTLGSEADSTKTPELEKGEKADSTSGSFYLRKQVRYGSEYSLQQVAQANIFRKTPVNLFFGVSQNQSRSELLIGNKTRCENLTLTAGVKFNF